jgi:predicted TPR repeat methyltransferase
LVAFRSGEWSAIGDIDQMIMNLGAELRLPGPHSDPLIDALVECMRSSGVPVTDEESAWERPEDCRLLPTRRSAQSSAHIVNLSSEAGLHAVGHRELSPRLGEDLEPVCGMVFLLRRP